jgi:hypothetical protein
MTQQSYHGRVLVYMPFFAEGRNWEIHHANRRIINGYYRIMYAGTHSDVAAVWVCALTGLMNKYKSSKSPPLTSSHFDHIRYICFCPKPPNNIPKSASLALAHFVRCYASYFHFSKSLADIAPAPDRNH